MSVPRRTLLIGAAVCVLACAALFVFRIRKEMVDFSVNYAAGDRLLHGETLYRVTDEHFQFKYSPFCAILYIPPALLPLTAAKAVWFAGVILASFALFRLTGRLLSGLDGRISRGAVLVAGLILAKFLLREIQLGQINAILTAILMLMVARLVPKPAAGASHRDQAAGLLWGVASALKPYALIFLPYFILKRRWNVLWPALLVLGSSLIAPSLYYGFAGNLTVHEEWISSLSRSTPGLLNSQDNVSLLAMLVKWTGDRILSQPVYAVIVLLLAVLVFLFIRRGRDYPNHVIPEAALLLLLIPLISPLGWDYTFISAFLAVALILHRFPDFPFAGRVFLGLNFGIIALSIYDLMGRKAYAAFMAASVPTLNFVILAGALCFLRWARKT